MQKSLRCIILNVYDMISKCTSLFLKSQAWPAISRDGGFKHLRLTLAGNAAAHINDLTHAETQGQKLTNMESISICHTAPT